MNFVGILKGYYEEKHELENQVRENEIKSWANEKEDECAQGGEIQAMDIMGILRSDTASELDAPEQI